MRDEKTFTVIWYNKLTLPYEGLKNVVQLYDNQGCVYVFIYKNNEVSLPCYKGNNSQLEYDLKSMCVELKIPFVKGKLEK